MEEHGVVPDVIDIVPEFTLEVKYNDNTVSMGNELTPTQVKDSPTRINFPTEESAFYTLCMIDPDAPSRQEPKFREILHWLVVNIPGSTDINSGTVLCKYIGSGPPEGTGLHRYVSLVYKQPEKLTFDEKYLANSSGDRRNFKMRNFAMKYNLGQPVAGNFYQARYDDYVPKLHKELASRN